MCLHEAGVSKHQLHGITEKHVFFIFLCGNSCAPLAPDNCSIHAIKANTVPLQTLAKVEEKAGCLKLTARDMYSIVAVVITSQEL